MSHLRGIIDMPDTVTGRLLDIITEGGGKMSEFQAVHRCMGKTSFSARPETHIATMSASPGNNSATILWIVRMEKMKTPNSASSTNL
uniref:Transcriptional regulator n=1 Tax=Bursaphelenchus xylophilus TaxID=6326 RepID=A0A1I7SHU9_BURXY